MSSRAAAGPPPTPAETEALATGDVAAARAPHADVSAANGELTAQRDAPIGGQAVLEGVMMRGVSNWAVAVRKPPAGQPGAIEDSPDAAAAPRARDGDAAGEIELSTFPLRSALKRHRALRLPIIRGVVALGESLVIGFRALEVSANAQLPPEEEQEITRGMWAGTVFVALAFAVVLFFLIPVGLTSLIKGQLGSSVLFWIVEGVLRTSIFLGYLLLLSRVASMRSVFEYHGAEHKTISCFEAGLPLEPANAQRFSRLHPRCGTSFLLLVMVVAIIVFAPIGLPAWYWLLTTRLLGVPLIAGISFELIKFAGRNRRRRWVRAAMWPGMKLQLLTTREPNLDQLAVAIAALEGVLALEAPGSATAEDLVGVEVVA